MSILDQIEAQATLKPKLSSPIQYSPSADPNPFLYSSQDRVKFSDMTGPLARMTLKDMALVNACIIDSIL